VYLPRNLEKEDKTDYHFVIARIMKNKHLILSLVFVFALQAYAQNQVDMRETVEFLVSQELGGRYPVTRGDILIIIT
jgi:hypothetical protein